MNKHEARLAIHKSIVDELTELSRDDAELAGEPFTEKDEAESREIWADAADLLMERLGVTVETVLDSGAIRVTLHLH